MSRRLTESIAHIGVAVTDIRYVLDVLHALGFELVKREHLPRAGTVSNIIASGDARIELLEASDPAGDVARFLARRGPGLHHLCLRVSDLAQAIAAVERVGVQLTEREPSQDSDGQRVFLHPQSTGGTLIGLVEPYCRE